MNDEYGKPLFRDMKYCMRCCMPESNEGIKFDEMGICQACQSAEQKIHMDWTEREKELRTLLDHYKGLNNDYDCLIPISGGKDSTFQLHIITKVYKLKALAVTFSHNWWSETGKYNLQNAIAKFNVDHIMFTPSRSRQILTQGRSEQLKREENERAQAHSRDKASGPLRHVPTRQTRHKAAQISA